MTSLTLVTHHRRVGRRRFVRRYLTVDEMDLIRGALRNGQLFARKFDMERDGAVLDFIDRMPPAESRWLS